jgi:hypothetical protein
VAVQAGARIVARSASPITLAIALLLAACSEPANPSPAVPGSPSPAGTGSAPSDAGQTDVPTPPSIDPALAAGLSVTCGDDRAFPAESVVDQGGSESELDPASLALRQILTGPDGAGLNLPSAGWHRVIRTPTETLFVALALLPADSPWVMVSLMNAAGTWTYDSAGACQMTVALAKGIGPATWWLDPAAGKPAADATSVAAIVLERSCASGASPDGRVLPPAIRSGASAISVLVAIRHRPGDQDCQGNPPLAIRLDLGETIGSRALLDGGEFPPRDASVVPN